MQFLSKAIGFFRKRKSTKSKQFVVFCQDVNIGTINFIDFELTSKNLYLCHIDRMILSKNHMHLAFVGDYISDKSQKMPLHFQLDDCKINNAWITSYISYSISDDNIIFNNVDFLAESID